MPTTITPVLTGRVRHPLPDCVNRFSHAGKTYRLIVQIHDGPLAKGIPVPSEALRGCDGVVLEELTWGHNLPQAGAVIYDYSPQYHHVWCHAHANQIPIFYTDTYSVEDFAGRQQSWTWLGEAVAAWGLGRTLRKPSTAMTRREMGKWAATIWATLPLAEMGVSKWAGNRSAEAATAGAMRNGFVRTNEYIHPEAGFVVQTLRNLVLAQKATTLACSSFPRPFSELAQILGTNHEGGFEAAIKLDPSDRVGKIAFILNVLDKMGCREARKGVSEICRLDAIPQRAPEQEWDVNRFSDPLLRHLDPIAK